MPGPIIEIKNLSFHYGKPSDFEMKIPSWSLQRGERVFLHGPSGSGKTTLLGALTGILEPQAGSLKILDADLTKMPSFARDRFRGLHIGYIFQQLNLIPYLSVRENILISIWNAPMRFRAGRFKTPEEEACFLAERLEIASHLDRYPHQLSIGQQQRVAVARALIGPPELLIADEPTSALDEDRQQAFLELLLNLAEEFEVSVLFVSHNRSLSKLFDRELSIYDVIQGETHAP